MNHPAQGGQFPQGQTQGQPGAAQQQQQQQNQQRRPQQIILYKPEQMRNLPDQFTSEKAKWEHGLRQLWAIHDANAEGTQEHTDAKRKIFEFSKTLTAKMQAYRMAQQQKQQAQQAGGNGGAPGGAGAPQQGQGQPQTQAGEGSASSSTAEQQQRAKTSQVSAKVMEHVSKFPYVLPAGITQGTPEAAKWLGEAKQRYLKGLVAMEGATARLAALDAHQMRRKEAGKPLTEEEQKDIREKKEHFTKTHAEAKQFVDNFRNQQKAAQPQNQNQNQQASQQANQAPAGGAVNTNNGQNAAAPARPQLNPQQQAPNPAMQGAQAVNAAIEAAKNQQQMGARPMPQNQNNQISQSQMPGAGAPSLPQQQVAQNIKTETGLPPPINTSINQMQTSRPMQNSPLTAGGHPQSGHPQSAGLPQSANTQQPPRALTHQAALTQAARSYSSGNTTAPQVMGHSHPSATQRDPQINTNKMPIPKHLPERAVAPPQPVAINQARPTYSGGPSNVGNGVMSQPVLPKAPGYNMSGEGDRVMSRKKLDELVKQVTGGGNGDAPSLTPEVEESMLTVADTFVDQVLHAACKVAKERGSKALEIRDIQLTLERGYNIRIPGYASDEIRTVKKIQPATNWINKMSAVQASKVTGGKGGD
ncbi:hypothetical protein HYALB_00010686 [Hymenoscyphus albidus]|uniref:Transcription initiation factor TFIID subunit 12 domain-containing protein n=1 Tax=Hymenoscyphus albidus TaxID=595503 RepID=A0A9N9M0G7_9HELO|nr:hypothetical protein HYALB_00010686 [Hymenoscyphus albidus]